jgi:hypothetical protein
MKADHGGPVVYGTNRLRPLKHSDYGFESHSRRGRKYACDGTGIAMG